MSPRSSAQQSKGLTAHLHVTVKPVQLAKLRRLAKRRDLALSALLRNVIDDYLEVEK